LKRDRKNLVAGIAGRRKTSRRRKQTGPVGAFSEDRRMADTDKTIMVRKVCRKCGLMHEVEEPAPSAADEWKVVGLAAAGIVMLALVWFWVFKWGVPLVKYIKNLD
jgi:hypothetical protein